VPFVDPNTVNNPTTGQPAPASWGDNVRDNLVFLATNRPHCTVNNSTTQSVATAPTYTALTADTEVSDIGGMHSTSVDTERITVPSGEGGLYAVYATVQFAANATGYRHIEFYVNSTTQYPCDQVPAVTTASAVTILSGARTIPLSAGDWVVVRVRQASGGNLDVTLQDFSVNWSATA
jgi:hypothetical protein